MTNRARRLYKAGMELAFLEKNTIFEGAFEKRMNRNKTIKYINLT